MTLNELLVLFNAYVMRLGSRATPWIVLYGDGSGGVMMHFPDAERRDQADIIREFFPLVPLKG